MIACFWRFLHSELQRDAGDIFIVVAGNCGIDQQNSAKSQNTAEAR
jgi:hypothetical protein